MTDRKKPESAAPLFRGYAQDGLDGAEKLKLQQKPAPKPEPKKDDKK